MLIDSNVVIGLADERRGPAIRSTILNVPLYTCNIIKAETLGYALIAEGEEIMTRKLLASCENLPFDERVTEQVITIRKRHRIALPDAVIAATALVYDITLCTANVRDFTHIHGLKLLNPLGV